MASTTQEWNLAAVTALPTDRLDQYTDIYEENRHHVYSLAFWMTDSEIAADELTSNVFLRAFAHSATPSIETIDRALITELRELSTLGVLTLSCDIATEVLNVRRNILRTHLERAVVELPPTERMIFLLHDVEGYSHERISRLIGVSKSESEAGLHQSRLRIRELVAQMQ